MFLVIIALALVFLLLASYHDLRTAEVPERISRAFIVSMIFLSLVLSLYHGNFLILGITLVLGAAYFLFGYLTYYLGQWGGADVMVLTGIGLTLGLLDSLNFPFINSLFFPYYLGYFLNMGLVALPYAFFYGVFIGLKDRRVFAEFLRDFSSRTAIIFLALSFLPALLSLYFKLPYLSLIYLFVPLFALFSLFLKTLERVALVKKIAVSHLREGDVPRKDLFIAGQKISSRNIQGLKKSQITTLRELVAAGKFPPLIEIKFGIKFVPILLLAFLLLVLLGNPLELFL